MATKRNIGAALPQPQISTITIANTWAAADTVSVTINNKVVTMTCGSTMDTTAEVAAGLREVLGISTHDPASISADCTTTHGGYEFAEFRDLTCTVSGSVVTCTSVGAIPFTMTASVTTAGSGTAAYAVATAASGPNFFGGATNYEGGVAPIADDTVVFDGASASILYGLDTGLADLNITCTEDYAGDIGLPKINPRGYTEYRQRFLDAVITATTGAQVATLDGTGRRYIDYKTTGDGSNTLAVTVLNSSAASADGAAVQIVGGKRLVLTTYGGTVSVSDHLGESLTDILSVTNLGRTHITLGSTATYVDGNDTIRNNTGTIELHSPMTGTSNEIFNYSGTMLIHVAANIDAIYGYGGKVDMRCATCVLPIFYGGELDLTYCPVMTFSTGPLLFAGVTFRDPNNVNVNGSFSLNGCNPNDVKLHLKDNISYSTSVAPSPASH